MLMKVVVKEVVYKSTFVEVPDNLDEYERHEHAECDVSSTTDDERDWNTITSSWEVIETTEQDGGEQ